MNKLEQFVEKVKSGEFTSTEFCLVLVSVFLIGVLLGIFISPKKSRVLGSYNGSYNGNSKSSIEEQER